MEELIEYLKENEEICNIIDDFVDWCKKNSYPVDGISFSFFLKES